MSEGVRSFGSNTPQVIEILGKYLYANREVVLRELIQNAYDALGNSSKRGAKGGQIRVRGDSRSSLLEVIDNGRGMDEQEIEQYLSTLGESSKRLSEGETIGEYGIGFFSCLMLADQVEVRTRKGPSGEPLVWRYVAPGGYTIGQSSEQDVPVGTRVRLRLRPEAIEFAGAAKLAAVVAKYCNFLDCPIYINDSETPANVRDFAWELKDKVAQTRWLKDFLGFEPSFWKLGRTSSGSNASQFVMYLADQDTRQHVFSKRMFVTETVDYLDDLNFVGFVLNSPSLILKLDRDGLRWDSNSGALLGAVRTSIEQWLPQLGQANEADQRLSKLAKRHQETFRRLCLEKRDAASRLRSLIFFQVAGATDRLNVPDYLKRDPGTERRVLYVDATETGPARSLQVSAHRQQGTMVLRASDSDEVEVLRRICSSLDASMVELGTDASMRVDSTTDVALVHLVKAAEAALSKPVKLRSGPSHLPLLLEGGTVFLNPRNNFIVEFSKLRLPPSQQRQMLMSLFEVFEGLDSVALTQGTEGKLVRAAMRAFESWLDAFGALQNASARLRYLEEPWWQPARTRADGALPSESRPLRCLLAYPFQSSYEDFKAVAREVCDRYGVLLSDASALETKPLLEKVCVYIHECDFAIVDITEHNPNVLFEYGLLMARRKPVILTRSKKAASLNALPVPADIVSLDRIEYENHSQDLKTKLATIVAKLVGHAP